MFHGAELAAHGSSLALFFVAFQDLVTRDLLDCLDISADLHVLFRLYIFY